MFFFSHLSIHRVGDEFPQSLLCHRSGGPPPLAASVDEVFEKTLLVKRDPAMNLSENQTMFEIELQVESVNKIVFPRSEGGGELFGAVLFFASFQHAETLFAVGTEIFPLQFQRLWSERQRVVFQMQLLRILQIHLENVAGSIFQSDLFVNVEVLDLSLCHPTVVVQGKRVTHGGAVEVVGVDVQQRASLIIILLFSSLHSLGVPHVDERETSSDIFLQQIAHLLVTQQLYLDVSLFQHDVFC